ncbi:unnamed protein product [Closterium sp. NIES-54]
MGGSADEGPAIGADAVVSVVTSASTDVAAPAVVSVSAGVAATSVVCCITANALVRSASGIVCEYQKPSGLKSGSRSGGCVQVVKLTIASLCGEFSSDLLRDFCRGEGILQSFTLPDSPQQNGIAERCIGLVMEVARTSMIHAAAPHFLWPFAVRYTAHQLNLWPRVSAPKTSPTQRWTVKVGDASVFRSVPFYRLFPYHTAPSGVSQVDPLPGTSTVEVAVGSGAAPGAASQGVASGGAEPGVAEPAGAESEGAGSGGAELGGAEPAGVEPGGAESEGVEPGDAESKGAESRGAEPQGAALSGGTGDAGAGGAGVTARAGGTGGTAAVGHGGAHTRDSGAAGARAVGDAGAEDPTKPGDAGAGGCCAGGTGAGGVGVGGTCAGGGGAAGAGAVDPGAGGAGGTMQSRSYFVPLL